MDAPTGYADRQQRARKLCEQVAIAVSIISPKGLDRWDGLWEFVDGPNADFLIALASWEADPTDKAALAIEVWYGGLCHAWRLASAMFLIEGMPNK